MKTIVPAVLLLSLAMGPADTAGAKDDPRPSVEDLVRQFEEVVFGTELRGFQPLTEIKKWPGPFRITVESFDAEDNGETGPPTLKPVPVKPGHLEIIRRHVEEVVWLTGIATEDVRKTGAESNYVIKFVPRSLMSSTDVVPGIGPARLRQLGWQGGCYFLIWDDDADGTTDRGVIVVNKERSEDKIRHCLLEEIVQTLGLPNDVNSSWPSVFSNWRSSRETGGAVMELTRPDRILIRALYDPVIMPGMNRRDAMKKIRKVIGDLDRTMP